MRDYVTMRSSTTPLPPSAARQSVELQAKLFRGLSDPSRLSILRSLKRGERSVSSIVEETGLSQPNASAHLACLRECGLVSCRQEGRSVLYSLADKRIHEIFQAAEAILARVAERVYECTRYKA